MKRVQFEHSPIPYLFVLPQILIIAVFFLWPAAQALQQSFLLEDAFGLSSQFVVIAVSVVVKDVRHAARCFDSILGSRRLDRCLIERNIQSFKATRHA